MLHATQTPTDTHGALHGAHHGAAAEPMALQLLAPCLPGKAGEHGAEFLSRSGSTPRARHETRPHGAPQGAHQGAHHGAPHGAGQGTHHGAHTVIDAEYLIYRLEEAGRTLMALPHSGPTTKLRTARHDIVQSALEAYGWQNVDARLRPPIPSAAHITRMDEALDWIPLIPRDRYVLRRIIGARALISPITERHLFTWRRLAILLGADHKAIQRWHAQGIDLLVTLLNSHTAPHSTSQSAKTRR